MIDVTICIPTYNQASFVAAAVESALRQREVSVRVIVGDDGSTDGTAEVLAHIARSEPRVHVVRHATNLRAAGNCSAIMRLAQTRFVARLDSDDLLEPTFAMRLIALLQRHANAAYAHADCLEIDAGGRVQRVRRLARVRSYLGPEPTFQANLAGYRVSANVCLFRREALEHVGFYSSSVRMVDDYDLALRLAAAGWGNAYQPKVLARYRVWNDAAGKRARRCLDEVLDLADLFDGVVTAHAPRFRIASSQLALHRARRAAAFLSALCDPELADLRPQLAAALDRLGGTHPVYTTARERLAAGLPAPTQQRWRSQAIAAAKHAFGALRGQST